MCRIAFVCNFLSVDSGFVVLNAGHYMFQAPLLYLLSALTGQQTDISGGTLALSPRYECPYVLPVTLAGTEASIACQGNNTYTMTVYFGQLSLVSGGLSVSGSFYPGAVSLGPGQSVTW